MARFVTALVTELGSEGAVVGSGSPLIYESDLVGRIDVPAGFVCDLNSIPQPLWFVSPPSDYPEAGVVHDYLYATGSLPRRTADTLYREALGVLGSGWVRCRCAISP